MRYMYNSERLETNNFGDEMIVRESIVETLQFNPRIPSWTMNNI